MKSIALISGGKDSILAILTALRYGYEPAVLVNIAPSPSCPPTATDSFSATMTEQNEMDSYMYQTVGHEVVEQIAHCMQLPLRRGRVGRHAAKDQSMMYTAHPSSDDEVEELYRVLRAVQEEFPHVSAVTSGAILSNYQRHRVEHVCYRLGLRSVAFLWHRSGAEVLQMAARLRVRAVFVKTASIGLNPRGLLGQELLCAQNTLTELHNRFGVHMAGEGGEFETIVLNCPLFVHSALTIESAQICMIDDNAYAPSGYVVLRTTPALKSASEQCADATVLRQLRCSRFAASSRSASSSSTSCGGGGGGVCGGGGASSPASCQEVCSAALPMRCQSCTEETSLVFESDRMSALPVGAAMARLIGECDACAAATPSLCAVRTGVETWLRRETRDEGCDTSLGYDVEEGVVRCEGGYFDCSTLPGTRTCVFACRIHPHDAPDKDCGGDGTTCSGKHDEESTHDNNTSRPCDGTAHERVDDYPNEAVCGACARVCQRIEQWVMARQLDVLSWTWIVPSRAMCGSCVTVYNAHAPSIRPACCTVIAAPLDQAVSLDAHTSASFASSSCATAATSSSAAAERSRSCLVSARAPSALWVCVEVSCVARQTATAAGDVLHVQSQSCWAAGFPGPRAQARRAVVVPADTHTASASPPSCASLASGSLAMVVMVGAVAGIVPMTWRIASAADVTHNDAVVQRAVSAASSPHRVDLAAQFAYSFANCAAYLNFFGKTVADVTRVRCYITHAEDVAHVRAMWNDCCCFCCRCCCCDSSSFHGRSSVHDGVGNERDTKAEDAVTREQIVFDVCLVSFIDTVSHAHGEEAIVALSVECYHDVPGPNAGEE